MLLPGVVLAGAREALEQVRQATPGGQTVSIGVAQWEDGESIGHAVARADRALYDAKEEGRDRVRVHSGSRATGVRP